MPEDMGFLLGEMAWLMVAAGVLGLICGWMIFGGRARATPATKPDHASLSADLARSETARRAGEARIAALQAELVAARKGGSAGAPQTMPTDLTTPEPRAEPKTAEMVAESPWTPAQTRGAEPQGQADEARKIRKMATETEPTPPASSVFWTTAPKTPAYDETVAGADGRAESAAKPPPDGRGEDSRLDLNRREEPGRSTETGAATPGPATPEPEWLFDGDPHGGDIAERDYDGDGIKKGALEGRKPHLRAAPRAGGPDDLQLIRGIGPKIEALCHKMGVYHFEQIAAWTDVERAWMDANLDGYKGRPSRDQWVLQAQALLASKSASR